MPYTADKFYALPVLADAPIKVLPKRKLRIGFPLPSPMLRALSPSEQVETSLWSDWLAEWGWTWAVAPAACAPEMPLVDLWLNRTTWPRGFDARVLAMAVALRLRVDGKPLMPGLDGIETDIQRVWRTLSGLPKEALSETLALALLRANTSIFQFDSTAPQWPADVGRVIGERRALVDEREPAPILLKQGYALLGEAFGLLRAMGSSLEDCQEVWDSVIKKDELPWAFEMAFWWEATYCLTERHAYDAAEKAQILVAEQVRKLEALTGLIDPMWHHQQGRLYYYAGNHELALAEFLREYQSHGEDLEIAAMLHRELANVLSDLACLERARHFAAKSELIARNQGQKVELFKSLGRLAEITIKLGDVDTATKFLLESLSIQEKLGNDNRAPAQTLTYLGHAAVLSGDIEKALQWYERAKAKDNGRSSMPYITMGRFAVAHALGNAVEIAQLWNAHRDTIEQWQLHQTHVLPAAVCTLVASRCSEDAKLRLPGVVRLLVESRYAIEAAYALPSLPLENQEVLSKEIIAMLRKWDKALDSFPRELKEIVAASEGIRPFIEAIRHKRLHETSQLASACYPMNLAG